MTEQLQDNKNTVESDTVQQLWSLYLIETNSGQLYCGISNNVARRFSQHSQQTKQCARFLRGKGPLKLRYQVELGAKSIALKSEYRIKRWPRQRKWQMIDEQWPANKLLRQCRLESDHAAEADSCGGSEEYGAGVANT